MWMRGNFVFLLPQIAPHLTRKRAAYLCQRTLCWIAVFRRNVNLNREKFLHFEISRRMNI